MNKEKKLINKIVSITITIATVLLLFIVSGCTQFDVDFGIDSDNTAFLSYRLQMDISEFDVQQQHNFKSALYGIATHYRDELNFDISLNTESSPVDLSVEKRIANNSFEEAFESLRSLLKDVNMSIFMQVDMAMTSYQRHTGYVIGATADIPRIIKSHDTENLPSSYQASLEDAILTSRGTITVTLPASETVNASHALNIDYEQVIMSVPLSFTEQTGFDLSAVVNLPSETPYGSIGAIIEQQLSTIFGIPDETGTEQQERLRSIAQTITMAAAGLVTLTLIIAIVVVVVKRNS